MVSFPSLGLNTEHDRAVEVREDRIDQHLHIVTRNRKDLSNIVLLPKPPVTPHEPPREFRYIQPTQEEIDQAKTVPEIHPTPEPSQRESPKKQPKPRTPTPPPAPKKFVREADKIPPKDEEKLQNAVKVFDQPLVVNVCFSKVIKDKSEAIENLKTQVETYSKDKEGVSKPGLFFKATSEVLQYLLKTSIWNCFQSGCSITVSLMDTVVDKYK